MSMTPEIWFGIGAAALGAALIWGVVRGRRRGPGADGLRDAATRAQYREENDREEHERSSGA